MSSHKRAHWILSLSSPGPLGSTVCRSTLSKIDHMAAFHRHNRRSDSISAGQSSRWNSLTPSGRYRLPEPYTLVWPYSLYSYEQNRIPFLDLAMVLSTFFTHQAFLQSHICWFPKIWRTDLPIVVAIQFPGTPSEKFCLLPLFVLHHK